MSFVRFIFTFQELELKESKRLKFITGRAKYLQEAIIQDYGEDVDEYAKSTRAGLLKQDGGIAEVKARIAAIDELTLPHPVNTHISALRLELKDVV